jgi:hypothetical protein
MNLRQQIIQDRSEALAALRVLRGRASKLLTWAGRLVRAGRRVLTNGYSDAEIAR